MQVEEVRALADYQIVDYYGRLWKSMEEYGRVWKILEDYGRLWNIRAECIEGCGGRGPRSGPSRGFRDYGRL